MTEQKKRYFKAAQGFVAGIDWIEIDNENDVIAQLDNGERSLCTSITAEQVQERVDSGEWREYDYAPAGDLNVLAARIEQWGADKGILEKSDPYKQFEKLREEVEETSQALFDDDQEGIVDGIGDCFVVLTLLARLCGTDIEHCVRSAYNEIKSRKGMMVDGKFQKFEMGNVKESHAGERSEPELRPPLGSDVIFNGHNYSKDIRHLGGWSIHKCIWQDGYIAGINRHIELTRTPTEL